ncbi:MAG: putative adhesin, partial [Bacteroidota bacterium]
MNIINKWIIFIAFLLQGFVTFSSGNCTNTVEWGIVTAPTGTAAVEIETCSYEEEYSVINSVVSGSTYVLTSSCGSYITLHSASFDGPIVAQGFSPLTFTATTTGSYFPSWNTNSNCGTAVDCCTTTIQCTSCSLPPPPSGCTNTSAFGTVTAPTTNNSVTISTNIFQTQYSTINNVVAGNTYVLTNSCGGYITVHSGTFNGPIVAQGNAPLTFTATTSGSYFPSWNTNSACGTASNPCTATIQCTSCSPPPPSGCTNTSPFGTVSAPTGTGTVTISNCSFQTEYSTINNVVAGSTYIITNSCGGYITLHSSTFNGPIVAQGNAPLTFTATTSGSYFPSWNTNSACGTASNCCTTTIQCSSCSPPPPCVSLNGNTSCIAADPFCSSSGLNFCNTTNSPSQGGGGVYGCLLSTPNPSFFYLNVTTSGSITLAINQTSSAGFPIDVDYVLWGPFSSQNNMCTGYAASNIVGCSYSGSASETATITNAVAGQWYLILITNFSNQSGAVSFTQTSGSGTTNCNILCNMTGLTATPGACNSATNQYSVTGTINFSFPPTSGTLTVSSSCGASTSIAGPWTSPLNYTLTGIPANGAPCSITAVFSADPTCTFTQAYTAPPSCSVCTSTAVPTQPTCSTATGSILVTATSGTAGYNVSWSGSASGNPGGTEINALNGTYTISNLTPGTYTITVTATGGCTSTNTVTINAQPATPTMTSAASVSICSGQSVGLVLTSNPIGSTYSWIATNNNNVGGESITAQTSSTINNTLTNTTGSTQTVSYSVTPTLNGCVGTAQTVSVNVSPITTPTFTQVAAICSGGSLSALPTTSNNSISGTWS